MVDKVTDLKSTGLCWDRDKILKRNRSLRKINSFLSFDLVYYPYWIISVIGKAKGRWLPARPIMATLAVDAVCGSVYRLLDAPDGYQERIIEEIAAEEPNRFMKVDSEHPDSAAVYLSEIKVYNGETDAPKAETLAVNKALEGWRKKFSGPFKPQVQIDIDAVSSTQIYKPFWILQRNDAAKSQLVVDATTGIAGAAEFRPVLTAWNNG